MEKTFEGKTYESIPEHGKRSCIGCIAPIDGKLCYDLRADESCIENNVIWREKVIKIVPVDKSKYEIAMRVHEEWLNDVDDISGFGDWCRMQFDPEYTEYQRLKAKFERK